MAAWTAHRQASNAWKESGPPRLVHWSGPTLLFPWGVCSLARGRPPGVSAKGLRVSQVVQRFLENLLNQRQVGHGTCEPLILLLDFLSRRDKVTSKTI